MEPVRLTCSRYYTAGEVIEQAWSSRNPSLALRWVFTFIVGPRNEPSPRAMPPHPAVLPVTPENVAALYNVMRQGAWRKLDGTVALERYLCTAVHREAQRIRGRQRADDRLRARREAAEGRRLEWCGGAAVDTGRRVLPRRGSERTGPQREAEPTVAAADAVLDRLDAQERLAGMLEGARLSTRQRDLVALMLSEHLEPAVALARLGLPMSVWVSLVQKLRRRAA
jgi:hypothetical protein